MASARSFYSTSFIFTYGNPPFPVHKEKKKKHTLPQLKKTARHKLCDNSRRPRIYKFTVGHNLGMVRSSGVGKLGKDKIIGAGLFQYVKSSEKERKKKKQCRERKKKRDLLTLTS